MTIHSPADGRDGHRAAVREVALLWGWHHPEPFPEVPLDDKLDGTPGQGHPGILRNCLPELRTPVALLGRSAEYHEGHRAFQRLLTMAEPILADGPGS